MIDYISKPPLFLKGCSLKTNINLITEPISNKILHSNDFYQSSESNNNMNAKTGASELVPALFRLRCNQKAHK